jgi:hypothetical protein
MLDFSFDQDRPNPHHRYPRDGDPQAGLELAAADLIRMARGRLAAIAATNAPNPTSS